MFTARAAVSSAAESAAVGAVLAQAASAAKLAAMTTSFRMFFIGSPLGLVLLDEMDRPPGALPAVRAAHAQLTRTRNCPKPIRGMQSVIRERSDGSSPPADWRFLMLQERENASLDFFLSEGFERGIWFRASPTPAGRRMGHVDCHLALLGLAGQLQLHTSVGRSSPATCQPAIVSERVEADGRFCEPAPGVDLRFNDHGLDSVFL